MKKKALNKAAQALGRMGTKNMTKAQISEHRRAAVNARWARYRARKAAEEAEASGKKADLEKSA